MRSNERRNDSTDENRRRCCLRLRKRTTTSSLQHPETLHPFENNYYRKQNSTSSDIMKNFPQQSIFNSSAQELTPTTLNSNQYRTHILKARGNRHYTFLSSRYWMFMAVVMTLVQYQSKDNCRWFCCEAWMIQQPTVKSRPSQSRNTLSSLVDSRRRRISNDFSFTSLMSRPSLILALSTAHQSPSSSSFSSSSLSETTSHTQYQQQTSKKKPKGGGSSKKDQIYTLFRGAKNYEKMGQWNLAIQNYEYILQHLKKNDAHSYLALAKLQTKRQQYTIAQQIYQNGILACPNSIHLLQAYAIYEETITQNITMAQELYERALRIDSYNPYVCHAYSCMERKMGNISHAISLLQQTLYHTTNTTNIVTATPTAAVVCTLGELYITQQLYDRTRQLYEDNIPCMIQTCNKSNNNNPDVVREVMEVYLAYAWLEERYYHNFNKAEILLHQAMQYCPNSSMIQIALSRLEGRRPSSSILSLPLMATATTTATTTSTTTAEITPSSNNSPQFSLVSASSAAQEVTDIATTFPKPDNNNPAFLEQRSQGHQQSHHNSNKQTRNNASIRRLASACMKLEQQQYDRNSNNTTTVSAPFISSIKTNLNDIPTDGRIYNAWANIEVKSKRYHEARKILYRGLIQFPYDHTLLQATGKVEERLGNYSGAQHYYGESLRIQPSAPTLVAYALLNMKDHYNSNKTPNTRQKPTYNKDSDSNQTAVLMEPQFNFQETKRLFEEALMIDRRHGPAYNAYARTVMEYEQNVTLARMIYARGIHANCSDMASIYHGYARLELQLGNIEVARNILMEGQQEVNRINIGTDSPHRDRAVFLTHTLGMLELNHHRHMHAYEVFIDGIDRYGISSQLLLGTALALVKLGREKQAREYFEQAVTTDERHAQAWQAWGMMEMRNGNYKTAKIILECGIRSTPRYGPLWHACGLLESRTGNIELARKLFEKGIAVAPHHVGLYQSWATLELREENYSVAKALIAEALTRDKQNGVGWLIAADIEQQIGNDGLALLVLRRGIECSESSNNNNNKVRLYRALGDTLVRLGKIVEARQVLEQGINIDPLYAPLYHSLAELEARVGNVEELARLNKRTASIFNTNALLIQQNDGLNNNNYRSTTNTRSESLPSFQSTEVSQSVVELAKRIVPMDDEEEDKVFGNINRQRQQQPNESSIFLDNLMNSYCLDDDGICDLILRGDNEGSNN